MTGQIVSVFEVDSIAGCVCLLALGILLVIKGGDWFVDAASWIAGISGIPTFIIGATIVSLATTLPEVLVSSIAAGQGSAGMAIGNAVGSVNCNIALIMALSLLFLPSKFKRKDYAFKMCTLLAAISVLWAVSATADGTVTWWEGVIVLLIFVIFMAENVMSAKRHAQTAVPQIDAPEFELNAPAAVCDVEAQSPAPQPAEANGAGTITLKRTGKTITKKDLVKNILLFVIGAAFIVLGAQLMCDNGAQFARLLHVPEDIIGVTILAVGTSLPELVTAVTAIIKKKADLSVGNIVGANIIDISLILPLCAFISMAKFGTPLPISPQSAVLDFPFCLSAAAVALVPALIAGRFKRWQGALLLAGYATYITLLVLNTLGVIAIFGA